MIVPSWPVATMADCSAGGEPLASIATSAPRPSLSSSTASSAPSGSTAASAPHVSANSRRLAAGSTTTMRPAVRRASCAHMLPTTPWP